MTATTDRRRTISVQDLLCNNPSHSSPCRSTSTIPAPSSAAFSSPQVPYEHHLHQLSQIPSPHFHPSSHSDLDMSHCGTTHTSAKRVAESLPHLSSNHPTYSQETQHNCDTSHRPQKPIRGPWRIEEDRLLIQLVHLYGPRQWSRIATHFPNRTGKQARERWMNQLNPDLKKKNWTAHEDRIILRAHASLGNKWSAIANLLPGRTDNSVKNRFNSTLKRAMKEKSLTTQTLDVEQFVQALHAKPFLLEHELQLGTDASTNPATTHHSHRVYDAATKGDTATVSYLEPPANRRVRPWSPVGAEMAVETSPRCAMTDGALQRNTCVLAYHEPTLPWRQVGCNRVQEQGATARARAERKGDEAGFEDSSTTVCGLKDVSAAEYGRRGYVGAQDLKVELTPLGRGFREDFCLIRESVAGRRESSPEKSIVKRRHR